MRRKRNTEAQLETQGEMRMEKKESTRDREKKRWKRKVLSNLKQGKIKL